MKKIIILLLCLLFSMSDLAPMIFNLKSGEKIEGEVTYENSEYYLVSTGYGEVRIFKSTLVPDKPARIKGVPEPSIKKQLKDRGNRTPKKYLPENESRTSHALKELEAAKKLYQDENATDFKKSFEHFLNSAELGNAEAQYYAGIMYYSGQGVDRSRKEAYRWFRTAALSENADAAVMVALLIDSGELEENSSGEKAFWFEKAAEKGNMIAQYHMGRIWHQGLKRPADIQKAVSWYTRAAEQGSIGAQFILAELSYYGRGIPVDYHKSLGWYSMAASQGDLISKYMIGLIYFKGLTAEPDMEHAFKWFREASQEGYARATYRLARMYWYGEGTSPDHGLSESLIQKVKDQTDESDLVKAADEFYQYIQQSKTSNR